MAEGGWLKNNVDRSERLGRRSGKPSVLRPLPFAICITPSHHLVQARRHRAAGGDSFTAVIGEHACEVGIGALRQTTNAGVVASQEERLEHHLVQRFGF